MGDTANSEPVRDGHKPPLEVAVCSTPARSWVTLTGDLDLASAPHLQRVFDQLCRDGYSEVVVDLTGLDFLGAIGLRVLLRADDQLRATGARLILHRPPRAARRILAITELDTVLTIRPGELAPSRPHDHQRDHPDRRH